MNMELIKFTQNLNPTPIKLLGVNLNLTSVGAQGIKFDLNLKGTGVRVLILTFIQVIYIVIYILNFKFYTSNQIWSKPKSNLNPVRIQNFRSMI